MDSSAKPSLPSRPVYPYSVIPGGVANAKEVQAAVAHDPVVAEHYAGFQARSARVIRLAKARHAYVSYRLGHRVYWTRKKVALARGEVLLSDGAHLLRARCGNRISERPQEPVSPQEPTEAEMTRPVVPSRLDVPTVPVPGGPLIETGLPPVLLAGGPEPPSGGPGGFPPPIPVLPCCGGPSGPTPPPPPGPPVSTPEPSSAFLLLAGLGGVLILWKFRRP